MSDRRESCDVGLNQTCQASPGIPVLGCG